MENSVTQNSSVMSVKDWFITLLITAIPVVGFIMLFVWAFGGSSTENPTRANWAKAALLLMIALFILYIIFFVVFASIFMSSMDSFDMDGF